MDFLRQLIDGDVRRCADKDLPRVHFREMIDDGGRSDGLSSTRRTLNQADRFLKDALDRIHLRMIEFGKSRSRETLRHLGSQGLGFKFVSKKFVILDDD